MSEKATRQKFTKELKKSRGLLGQRVELQYEFIRQQMKADPITGDIFA